VIIIIKLTELFFLLLFFFIHIKPGLFCERPW